MIIKNIIKLFILIIFFVLIIFLNSSLANSLITTVYVPEGIVMAADSRQTLTIGDGMKTISTDNVTKIFLLEIQQVGISACGQSFCNEMPVSSQINKFIEEKLTNSDDVITVAHKLVKYFRKSFGDVAVFFYVSGYKKENKVSIPYVYFCSILGNKVERKNIYSDNTIKYGLSWNGELDILESIINPVIHEDEHGNKITIREVEPISWKAMSLQDAIDFSIYAIQTTIDTMRFQARPKTVGGPIDVLLLTPQEVKWIQKKKLHGEIIKQE